MSWTKNVFKKADILREQINAARSFAERHNLDPDAASDSYNVLLELLFERELPLAKALDRSNVMLHVEGDNLNRAPSVSLVSSLITNFRDQVLSVTKAIAGISASSRLKPETFDLGISGMAPGSLYIGFTVEKDKDHISLFNEEEPIYEATLKAFETIKAASSAFSSDSEEEIDRRLHTLIPEPRIRDTAIMAISRLSPSKQSGIAKVGFVSVSGEDVEEYTLTTETRSEARRLSKKRISSTEGISLTGYVREIDLDAKRFELRNITTGESDIIRCIYFDFSDEEARSWLDRKIIVSGKIERRLDGKPSLLEVDDVKTPVSGSGHQIPINTA